MTSPQAQWQRGMMDFDPSTCWCFVAPDRVCVRARPCPLHERAAVSPSDASTSSDLPSSTGTKGDSR